MADKQSLVQRWNPRLRNPMLKVESVVAFRECWLCRPCASAWDWGGIFRWGGDLPVAAFLWVLRPRGSLLRLSVRITALLGWAMQTGGGCADPLPFAPTLCSPLERDRDKSSLLQRKSLVTRLPRGAPRQEQPPRGQLAGRDPTSKAKSMQILGTTSA